MEIFLRGVVVFLAPLSLTPNIEGSMVSSLPRLIRRLPGVCGTALLALACSDNGMQPMAELEPLVGVWEARSLTVSDPDNPGQRIDLVDGGASYTLSILSTGQYTAVFDMIIARGHEAGNVELSGDQIALTPTSPPGPSTAGTWMFQGDTLRISAVRLVDYDEDSFEEAVDLHFDFLPRGAESP